MTCTVTGNVSDIQLQPMAGVTVTFTPTAPHVLANETGVSLPEPVRVTTDAGGAFTVGLFAGSYAVAFRTASHRHDATIVVPAAATAGFRDTLTDPLPPTPDAAQQAVLDARAARDAAEQYAQDALENAENATVNWTSTNW
ncbi:Carboxypeptidase regulatory-like domain-containing protein [Thalassovita litoralis]|uniref:Carboxypeptidase regulatory-like domain-containing protein n=1 Tax=Thalassovita litoralis TaxID=1010611 RepID=A0A521DQE6_9RHOB|nr:carboxypeptidase regulatory-like domain-containing protein [Thalassovita litoralis]SMO73923.1 Carboxypeptidase regulatory-like domain-containing protein [Thalassovita litoralis]